MTVIATTPAASTRIERFVSQQALVYSQMRMMLDAAEREGRAFNDAEEKRFKELQAQHASFDQRIAEAEGDDQHRQQLEALTGRRLGTMPGGDGGPGGTAGERFARETREYFAKGHHRAREWATSPLELPYGSMVLPSMQATTLTEGAGSGGALVVPQFLPGVLPTATRAPVIVDLLGAGTTTSNAVVYMKETAFTNAATPVAEGAAKPESALTFAQVTEVVAKIAHWLPVTEELLEDVGAIAAYIDSRLRLGVALAEDDQLLNGNGTPPNLLGLLNRSGLGATVTQGAGESAADAILRQISALSVTALTAPTGIILNPSDWATMQGLKTSQGAYIGNTPFQAPMAPSLWGLPCALSLAIAPKLCFVGAFSTMATWFRRGGLRVEASNSHQDFFVKNLVALRCEERGALAVYRPAAFAKVVLL